MKLLDLVDYRLDPAQDLLVTRLRDGKSSTQWDLALFNQWL